MSTEPAGRAPGSSDWRIALIGYGEVGRTLAEDLRARGIRVTSHDTKFSRAEGDPLRAHAAAIGVSACDSAAQAIAGARLIISAVTASQTVAVAASCARDIEPACFFLDFNSASPGAKKRAAGLIDTAGGRYVEGAVMTSVPPYRIRVPLLLGGPHARLLLEPLNALGFAASLAAEEIGVASATKMCRSIMIKGLEAMVIEAFVTARAYGVEDAVIDSLTETFPGIDWEKQGSYFFARVIQHGRRRAEEVREVAQTVRDIGLTSWSADGTARRQAWIADLADAGLFGARDALRTDWRIEADRILEGLTDSID